jgi:hypothetical protein
MSERLVTVRVPPSGRLGRASVVVAVGFALAGCGSDFTRTIGFNRDAPDEFRVTTRAPLSMPPDFDVRPPRPGAPRPQERSLTTQAEEALVPEAALNRDAGPGAPTPGEQALIAQAGPPAPANIRAEVNSEAQIEAQSHSFTDSLLFWKAPTQPGAVVDPKAEAQRLQQNAALGESPTTGNTPIIQRKTKPGLFDTLF